MKTDNIYIAPLSISTDVKFEGNFRDFLLGPGVKHIVKFKFLRYTLVKIDEAYPVIDLKTKKEYYYGLPTSTGEIFINPNKKIPFNEIYLDVPRKLSKRKILKMGNQVIEEIYKKKNEEKNK